MTAPAKAEIVPSPTEAPLASADLAAVEWPLARVTDALAALATAAGLTFHGSPAGDAKTSAENLAETVELWAAGRGLELETLDIPADASLDVLRRAAPTLVRIKNRGGVLAVLRVGDGRVALVGPQGAADLAATHVEDALHLAADPTARSATERLATALGQVGAIPLARPLRAARLLVAPTLRGQPLAEAWTVRAPAAGLKASLRAARLGWRLGGLMVGYLVQFALFLGIWRQIAARGFGPEAAGIAVAGWFWFLTFLVLWVIVQVAVSAGVSRLALDVGAVVRATLLRGALRLDPERMRSAGVGQLLGRALEAEALDSLALGGGVQALAGVFELVLGAVVLAWGAAPWRSLTVLAVVLLTAVGFAVRYAHHLATWGRTRRALTHDLVERMVGHRTVLIQDRADDRARVDDAALARYDAESVALDRADVLVSVAIPRMWLLVGLLMLAPGFFSGGAGQGASLAVAVGGVWLVYSAFRRLAQALPLLALARESWTQIAPLIGVAEATASGPAQDHSADHAPAAPLLRAEHITYRYQDRSAAVLNDVSLAVAAGDRVLLQGSSGGGKSTLASVLTGLRLPTSGRLRLRGIDQSALGLSRWRGAVGGAPQFHDNHVIGADLLFNLLMGRRWPPRMQDLADAEQICRELGLGALLDRMPAGLQQQVGETGWQLSHGERSRLFIARSLLQALDVRVLDESFAALDPDTLDQVMGAVLARPEALIVIAHP